MCDYLPKPHFRTECALEKRKVWGALQFTLEAFLRAQVRKGITLRDADILMLRVINLTQKLENLVAAEGK